jgi:hypothetical protein
MDAPRGDKPLNPGEIGAEAVMTPVQHQPLVTSTKYAMTAAALIALLVPAVFELVAAGQTASDRCNDACAALRHEGVVAGEPWYRSADSWQWGFQHWLALGCVIALIVAFALAIRGLPRIAIPLALASIVGQGVWLVVVLPVS